MNFEDIINQFNNQQQTYMEYTQEDIDKFVNEFINQCKTKRNASEHEIYNYCVWVLNGGKGYTTDTFNTLLPHVLKKLSG